MAGESDHVYRRDLHGDPRPLTVSEVTRLEVMLVPLSVHGGRRRRMGWKILTDQGRTKKGETDKASEKRTQDRG